MLFGQAWTLPLPWSTLSRKGARPRACYPQGEDIMIVRRLVTAGMLLALCLTAAARAEDKPNPAAQNLNRDNPRHKQFLKKVASGEGDVIFLGDSITQGWEGSGKKVWAENFGPLKAVNLGIGGDQTGHVLWRITEGKELMPLKPKVAVIMIGTNNMGRHSAEQIAGGVKAIVEELRKQKPSMKILVLGIFPRSAKPTDKIRDKVKATNVIIARLDDGKMVFYKDIGDKFLEKDGTLDRKIMPDLLHLSQKGYEIWAGAIKDDVQKLLK
jgi:lysophospholipase L1-like esterase